MALLDLVGFSKNTDEIQLKLIVRYQCEVRKALRDFEVARTLSIGDGTIFIFEGDQILRMPDCILAIDHAIGGFNLDNRGNGVPEISHRIGVHVGSAYYFLDYNQTPNYIGSGVNIAQRVSTCVPTERTPDFHANSTIYVSDDAKNEFERNGVPDYIDFYDVGPQKVKHDEYVHAYAMWRTTRGPTITIVRNS